MKALSILSGAAVSNKFNVSILLASVLALALTGFYRPAVAGQTAPAAPEATCPSGGQCFADVPSSSPFYEYVNNLYRQDIISGYACGGPGEPCDSQKRPYYRPSSSVTRAQMTKFVDLARKQPGIHVDTSAAIIPIYARTTADEAVAIYAESNSPGGTAVSGRSPAGTALSGLSTNSTGVSGGSESGTGVLGHSNSGKGVSGQSNTNWGVAGFSNSSFGVYGSSSTSYAGYFNGKVHVNGTLSKAAGSFKIDDPLDPANKYLYHSFVESPDMMNVYNGNVVLDERGEAIVEMPAYFEALNKEFRYQLTTIGGFAPVYIAEKVKDNHFKIAGGKAGMEVSWQVTGIRQDPYANEHRIPVEEDKPQNEKGMYLHPELYGQPGSKQIGKVEAPQLPDVEYATQP